jgi:abortive infection bacteriophage resistance protein
MAYAKPYLPISNQLALIKGRGMGISDDALAQAYLNKIGYYRLSGYWYPYRKTHMSNGVITVLDVFRVGTKFSEVVDLYVFDKKLRLLMMDVIERIEIALRVQITLQLGKLGAHAHRDPSALMALFPPVSIQSRESPITTTGSFATTQPLIAPKRNSQSTLRTSMRANTRRFGLRPSFGTLERCRFFSRG